MKKAEHEEEENLERWLVSYADFITLLFAFFTVLYATSQTDTKKMQEVVDSMNEAFNGQALDNLLDTVGLQKATGPTSSYTPPSLDLTLRPDMTGLLSNSPVPLGRQNQALNMEISQKVLFARGSAELYPNSFPVLLELAQALAPTQARLEVTGHATDDAITPNSPFVDNIGLAMARALVTVRYLEKNGMKPEHLIAAGSLNHEQWPDDRAVTMRVRLDEWHHSGEVLERLGETSFGRD